VVYSTSKQCGYCGAKLPDDLFSETYLDDTFTPKTAVEDVRSHLEKVLDILRQSGRGCVEWVEEMEAYSVRLRSEDVTIQKQAIVALGGRCHHQALGDANTVDYERYHHEVYELWVSCKRAMRIYDKQAA